MGKGNRNHDPAKAANQAILADRAQRIQAQESETVKSFDLGLNLKEPESQADNAVEFLRDEFDRQNFGEALPTYTRTIYGPDPLLDSCPKMKADIERMGLEDYADSAAHALLMKEDGAFADPVIRKGVRAAITKFGKESVADAIRDRILRIPTRQVEIEADRNDAMIYAQPMEEAVQRYGRPGFAPKFLSDRCIGVLGMRGYEIVKDERGDPVKVGTLIMGEIPVKMAEARRRHYAQESEDQVASMAEAFEDKASRTIRDSGRSGVSVLQRGEAVRSHAAGDIRDKDDNVRDDLTSSYLGRDFTTGFSTNRQV